MISSPMLAATIECSVDTVKPLEKLPFPLLGSPKLDGIRCLRLHDGRVVSRTFKPIPNPRVRAFLEEELPLGADGEIWVPGMNFNEIQNVVMNGATMINAHYAMFDLVLNSIKDPYAERMVDLLQWYQVAHHERLHPILPRVIPDVPTLLEVEKEFLDAGYEGIMLRTRGGPYKCGRSTLREGYLMKLKRMADSEAIVIGMEEKEFNDNPAEEDAFGRTKRSSHQANKRPAGVMGALVVRDIHSGIEFNIGTGFTDADRKQFWDTREKIINNEEWLACYSYQVVGTKNKPRFPSFKGWRSKDDVSG